MNVVCLVGKLMADPELKQTPQGVSVCSLAIFVNKNVKGDDGYYKSDLINLTAWRQTGEFISKYFRKGDMIGINGSIQTRQYQDKDTGKNRTAFEVLVNNAYFTGSKNESTNNNVAKTTAPTINNSEFNDFQPIASSDGNLPF